MADRCCIGARSECWLLLPLWLFLALILGALPVMVNSQGIMALGDGHTCAVAVGGKVHCWGRNDYGQLGLGHQDTIPAPGPSVDLGPGVTAVEVFAGGLFSCALTSDGRLKCWGDNSSGQLGIGSRAAAAGVAPDQLGSNLTYVELGEGVEVLGVTLGYSFACVVVSGGGVKCWGANGWGQLGYGDAQARGARMEDMADALPFVDLGAGGTALQVAAGSNHVCALFTSNQTKCWGANSDGQLGLGDTDPRGARPEDMGDALPPVDLGNTAAVVKLTARGWHTCALLSNGHIKCWGWNKYGQLGVGDTDSRGTMAGRYTPEVDLGTATATDVAAGSQHSCASLGTRGVRCWGDNLEGRLGLGLPGVNESKSVGEEPGEMGDALPAVLLGSKAVVQALYAGWGHSCAVLRSGAAKCWGQNGYGQLGVGDYGARGDRPSSMGDRLPALSIALPAAQLPVAPPPQPLARGAPPLRPPAPPPPPTSPSGGSGSSMNVAAAVGIALGVIGVVGLATLAVTCIRRRSDACRTWVEADSTPVLKGKGLLHEADGEVDDVELQLQAGRSSEEEPRYSPEGTCMIGIVGGTAGKGQMYKDHASIKEEPSEGESLDLSDDDDVNMGLEDGPEVNNSVDLRSEVHFNPVDILGGGPTSTVYWGMYQGIPVAIKILNLGGAAASGSSSRRLRSSDLEAYQRHLELLTHIRHPHVVRFYGGSSGPPSFQLQELMDFSLAQYIHSRDVPMSISQTLRIGRAVASALAALHPSVVHGNLKPQNILLNSAGAIKISDFSLGPLGQSGPRGLTQKLDLATVAYQAPECFSHHAGEVGEKVDVYALGVIMWACSTTCGPRAGQDPSLPVGAFGMEDEGPPGQLGEGPCGTKVRKLIKDCWRSNPAERPTCGEVVKRIARLQWEMGSTSWRKPKPWDGAGKARRWH